MEKKVKIKFLLFLTMLFAQAYAQEKARNFYDEIKNYNLSKIITADSILAEDVENTKEKLLRADPIGFIGDDYQRFYIHFSSVVQSKTDPYKYSIRGKTKVKETIRPFEGSLVVKQAVIGKNDDFPKYLQGYATCEMILQEDKNQTSTGIIKGTINIGYVIDPKKNFRYDALLFYTDGFSNNTFTGTWTSYKTKKSKKCNFGDYRIPESGDLDVGAGEFSPSPKYFDKGWKYYMLSMHGATEADVESGRNKEKTKWWK